ncbi:hypothetical protein GOP47_0024916 [Adiantum capillus-veneris]|uniref:Uncharacterized protein n=1 Tax=Adiantum capillus-veneris TaxID=13818 RepID=A0A9D4U5A8_ADICA|nr:hypothetical protein GOP47_0024916 [Adiantum capillus-veneris]
MATPLSSWCGLYAAVDGTVGDALWWFGGAPWVRYSNDGATPKGGGVLQRSKEPKNFIGEECSPGGCHGIMTSPQGTKRWFTCVSKRKGWKDDRGVGTISSMLRLKCQV